MRSSMKKKPSLVHARDVAGAQEVADELAGRLLRLLPVAQHHLRALDADLALLAERHLLGGIVEIAQRDDRAGQRQADRAWLHRPVERIAGRDRRGLRQAVALDQLAAGQLLEALLDLERQRRAARQAELERRQVEALELGVVDDRGEHRRHARHAGRLGRVDQLQGVVEHEARHDHDLGRQRDREVHHHGHREHVEERQRAHHALRRICAMSGAQDDDLQRVHVDVGVGQHGALGRAGGAAGVLQHGDVVSGSIGDRRRACRRWRATSPRARSWPRRRAAPRRQLARLEQPEQHRLGARQQAGTGHHGALQRAGGQQRLDLVEQHLQVERDHQLGLAVLDLEGQFLERVERVVVDDRAAGLEDGVVVDDEGRRVRQEQADLGALRDAELLQAGRGAVDQPADLAVSQALAEEIGAGPAADVGDGLVEQLPQRRGSKPCTSRRRAGSC